MALWGWSSALSGNLSQSRMEGGVAFSAGARPEYEG